MACTGKRCGWSSTSGSLECGTGTGGCFSAVILEAELSDFHDAQLMAATSKIREVLNAIPADSRGRKLSFINTDMGVLLAWVNHSTEPLPAGGVTIDDDAATVAKALKLKNVPASEYAQTT